MSGPILPVKVIESADLEENGGVYLVRKGIPAIPVHGFAAQGNRAVKGVARPVYVVSEAEFNAGDFVKGRGQPRPVGDIDDLGYVGALEGREAIPVWAVNDWPGSGSVPNAPSNLVATAVSTSRIDLSWTDNSGDETGFNIYRDNVLIDTVAVNETTYQDTGLDSNTLYEYYITAINAEGASSPSNTSSATTAMTYTEKVLSYSPIAYWPLTELSGLVADNAEGTAARDGTYSGVTLDSADGPIVGTRAGRWDGVNDYCNIYSASLNGVFNGAEGSLVAWVKVFDAGVWTDGSARVVVRIGADSTNYYQLWKNSTNNQLIYQRWSGIQDVVVQSSVSPTAWFNMAVTWSQAADQFKAYYNGVQVGVTQTGLGAWTLALNSNLCSIGSNSIAVPANVFNGHISQVAVFASALSGAAILDLATV